MKTYVEMADNVIKRKNEYMERRNKNMKNFKIFTKIFAVVLVIFLGGNAIAFALGENNIYTMIYKFFAPNEEEKLNTIDVEGEKEDIQTIGVESNIGYSIQYDEESFKLERSGDKDYYRVVDMEDEIYFLVYHTNTSYNDLKPDNVEEITINGRNAFTKELIDGKEFDENSEVSWDSDVLDTWYIDDDEGTYIIEVHYFLEAQEGWGKRISQMINTFEVVEK